MQQHHLVHSAVEKYDQGAYQMKQMQRSHSRKYSKNALVEEREFLCRYLNY